MLHHRARGSAFSIGLILLLGLAIPELAEAGRFYTWKRNASGEWAKRDNWNCIPGDVNLCGANDPNGYPKDADDVANFDRSPGTLDPNTEIVVNQTDIRIGTVVVSNTNGIQIKGTGQLILETTTGSPAEIISAGADAVRGLFLVPIVTHSLAVTVGQGKTITFLGVGPAGGGVTIRGDGQGSGVVEITERWDTVGDITLESGRLDLRVTPNPAFRWEARRRRRTRGQRGRACSMAALPPAS